MCRGEPVTQVLHLDAGQVVSGIVGRPAMPDAMLEHQLGSHTAAGWLDATAAVLALPVALDVVAQTSVVVRMVPLQDFRSALADHHSALYDVLQDVALAHRQQTELAVSRLAKDAEARCAEWLLRHAQSRESEGCWVQLQQHKRLIAGQLGMAPETLSRALRHLRERSLISGSGRMVQLVDPSGLRALAGL